jgi:prepilin-type N-terminal cleavage/methylation domain-containing protein
MTAGARTAGFSLVEVMVTLGILAVGMALASRLLIESQLGLVRTAAELGNPMPRYALALLRSDLEQATELEETLAIWRPTTMVLYFGAADRVVWGVTAEGDLERSIVDAAGRIEVRHVALRDVAAWRWRPTTPRLIDVELTYLARDTSRTPLADVARTWSPPMVERTVWLRTGLRAQPGSH